MVPEDSLQKSCGTLASLFRRSGALSFSAYGAAIAGRASSDSFRSWVQSARRFSLADFCRGSPRGRQHPHGWRPSPGPGPPGKTEPVSGGRPLHRRVMLVQRLGAEQVVQTGCGCGGRGGRRRRRRCCWRGCLRNGRGGRHGVAVLAMAGQILQRQGLAGRRGRVCLMTVAARA